MVTVANCFGLNEATQIKMLLESAGIPAFLPDEVSATMVPYQFISPSGVRVQVADDRAEEAKSLIEADKKEGQSNSAGV